MVYLFTAFIFRASMILIQYINLFYSEDTNITLLNTSWLHLMHLSCVFHNCDIYEI